MAESSKGFFTSMKYQPAHIAANWTALMNKGAAQPTARQGCFLNTAGRRVGHSLAPPPPPGPSMLHRTARSRLQTPAARAPPRTAHAPLQPGPAPLAPASTISAAPPTASRRRHRRHRHRHHRHPHSCAHPPATTTATTHRSPPPNVL
ncbi:Protein of unknown function [Gryllus bimaculatus]|nr:Protein of unknown function [Gryllus bimaculatus]